MAVVLGLLFSWLPSPLKLCVMAIIAVFIFVLLLKLVIIVLDIVFKFIGVFI